ncbi:MAG: aminotransferase class V-fold PLP-dependent enzyme [Clostridia bacterium]|nr:aminotransferase class V-fold PLP-dependent enzyme [Clostridia bacterium]
MIYLDNSATTYPKPQSVINAVGEAFSKFGANPGRSGHSFSIKTAIRVAEVREKIASFFNAESPENVIFTSGSTEALNLAILGSVKKGGHIICTSNDHNSALRPIFELEKQGLVEVSVASPKSDDKLRLSDIMPLVKENTYLICTNHISNVDGMETDISEIGRYAYKNGILFLVDSAQSAGHKQIDMLKQHIDFLAVAGHKGLYGPMGVGALVVSSKVALRPIKFGGTGTFSQNLTQPLDIPEGFESGTLPVPNILGLGAGVDFAIINQQKICQKLDDYTTYLNYQLNEIPGVKVYTHPDNANGVIAFNVGEMPSTEVSDFLDEKFGIMVRSGLHCAPLKHKHLGTIDQGVVRASISYFTTYSEIQKFLRAISILAKNDKI